MNKELKIYVLISFIAIAGLIADLIINGSYKSLIIICLIVVILLGMGVTIFFLNYGDEITNNKYKKHYNKLKLKKHKNVYDLIYIKAYQRNLTLLLKEKLKLKKLKNINDLNTFIYNIKKIGISFYYNGYYIEMFLYKDKIIYRIDTPEEYDSLESNKAFEKKQTIYVNFIETNNLTSFIDLFGNILFDMQNDINTFTKENNYDPFFNGKILNKFESSSSYLKTEGIICTIFSILITTIFICMFYISITDYEMKLENLNEYYAFIIVSIFLIGLGISFFIYGLNYVVKYFNLIKDIRLKRMSVINEPLKRVRIIYDQPGRRSNIRKLRYIKLYYKNISLLVPLRYPESFIYVNKKDLYNELLTINGEVKYLTKSKLVITGGNRYIQIAKKYITR